MTAESSAGRADRPRCLANGPSVSNKTRSTGSASITRRVFADWHMAGFTENQSPAARASPHFTITTQRQTVEFLVLRKQDRTEHVATKKELAEAKENSWIRIPRFDYTPSERLRFVLRGGPAAPGE